MSDFKVRIRGPNGTVRFEASAPIGESRAASYESFNIVHLPTSLWSYRNTNGRRFSISARIVSRNVEEAKANAAYIQTIKSWILPGFGATGSTPPILFLSGYNSETINDVPCILNSYGWTYPDDVDYIFDAPEPMPVLSMLQIDLEEAWSANQITNGDWRIEAKSDGSFSRVGAPGTGSTGDLVDTSRSVQKLISEGTFGGLAGPGMANKFPKLGGFLTLSPGMIAKLPTMASNVVRVATNNPTLAAAAGAIGGLINNRFISGMSGQVVTNNSNVSTPPYAPSSSPTSDPFGRTPPGGG